MPDDKNTRIDNLVNALGELLDREAIREVIHRYCQAVDRCDLDMLKGCYHPDGFDDHGFYAGNAHAFAEYVIPCLEAVESSVHAITNTRIKLDGNRASCSSQWSVIHRLKHKKGFTDFWHQGRYLDVFEKREGEWKILHRISVSDCDRWIEALNIYSLWEGLPNDPVKGSRGRKDPGYLWFDLLEHKPDRPAMADLWTGFHMLGWMTRTFSGRIMLTIMNLLPQRLLKSMVQKSMSG